MKILSLLLLFGSLLACQGKEKNEQSREKISQTEQLKPPKKDTLHSKIDPINSLYPPNTITRNIIQDKKGNYWLATWEGIIQYNGKKFINFTKKYGIKPARVFAILEDKTGKIWFGTVGQGIFIYDGEGFTHITTKDGLVNDTIGCFMEDKAGNVWIGTQNGVSKFDGKTFTNFTRGKGSVDDDINSIVEDRTGKLWFGTRGTAYIYDGKAFTTISKITGNPFVNVRSVIEDTKGNIWLGGSDGLWYNKGMIWSKISSNFVGYIYEDKRGNIWTSSEGTINNDWVLSRYNTEILGNKELVPTQIKAADGMFFGILEDSIGNIWWGSLNGINRYNGKGFEDFKEGQALNFKIN